MDKKERVKRLSQAARLAREVCDSLNKANHVCPTCGLKKSDNFNHAQTARELDAVVAKLTRLANGLGDDDG